MERTKSLLEDLLSSLSSQVGQLSEDREVCLIKGIIEAYQKEATNLSRRLEVPGELVERVVKYYKSRNKNYKAAEFIRGLGDYERASRMFEESGFLLTAGDTTNNIERRIRLWIKFAMSEYEEDIDTIDIPIDPCGSRTRLDIIKQAIKEALKKNRPDLAKEAEKEALRVISATKKFITERGTNDLDIRYLESRLYDFADASRYARDLGDNLLSKEYSSLAIQTWCRFRREDLAYGLAKELGEEELAQELSEKAEKVRQRRENFISLI